MVMHLACVNLRMSMPEALAAATINAAAALGLSEDYGSLEEGKWADMIIINANKWVHVYMALYMYLVSLEPRLTPESEPGFEAST